MKNFNKLNQCTMILTRDCNLRCNFCYAKKAGYSRNDMLNINNAKRIVDFCDEARAKYIVFTGGEPLKYPFLDELLMYISQRIPKIITAIPTNGILLEDKDYCKKLLSEGVNYFDISIKGKDSEAWVKATGFDGYGSQMKAIYNLSKLSIEFTVSMVITFDNVGTFCDSVKKALENGAKQFSFTFQIDNEESKVKDSEYLEKNNSYELIRRFLEQIDTLNSITDDWWIEYSFPLCVYSDDQLKRLHGRLASPCQIHIQDALTFDTEMNLLPCDMYIDQPIGKLGIDFSNYESFVSFSKTSKYQNIIDKLTKYPSDKCSSCEHLNTCFGGCPVLWKNYSFNALQNFKSAVL